MFKRVVSFWMIIVLIVSSIPMQTKAATEEMEELQYPTGLKPITISELSLEEIAGMPAFMDDTIFISEEERSYWTSFGSEYYYQFLDDNEKAFWDGLEEFCLKCVTSDADYSMSPMISIPTAIEIERLGNIMFLFQYSNPQYYFIKNNISYYSYDSVNAIGGVLYLYDDFQKGSERAVYTKSFTSKIDQWMTQIKAEKRPEDRLKLLHGIICANTVYDYDDLEDETVNPYDQSAYSMICMGRTVCAGYAKALTILANAAGIEAVVVSSHNHAWNYVNLHGYWYEIDPTWNDISEEYHEYYPDGYYYKMYNKSRATFLAQDQNNSHVINNYFEGMEAETKYDMLEGQYYANPYFTVGEHTYFKVNVNSVLGDLMVVAIEGSDPPSTVIYDNNTYVVTNGGTLSTPSPTLSPEDVAASRVKAFVMRMYTVALERDAEPGGLEYWTEQLLTKKDDGATVSGTFLLGEEMTSRNYGDRKYIDILYMTFFEREPDVVGYGYWCGLLEDGSTRGKVLAGFVNSDEFNSLCSAFGISRGMMKEDGTAINPGIWRFAGRLYTKVLQRDGEKDGVEYWALRIADGICTPEEAAKGFFRSDEYLSKNTSDEKYIQALYATFMNREAEPGGMEYWKNMLAGGTSREEVLSGFAQSNEFKGIMAEYGL